MLYYSQDKGRGENKMIKIKALMAINMDTIATTTTCYHCPLKWDCKKWFYYDYNVNNKMCDTVDETILFGKYDAWKGYGLTTEEAKKRNLKMCWQIQPHVIYYNQVKREEKRDRKIY